MLLLIFIAIAFIGLARMHGKKPWLYALIGIGTAFGAQLITGFVYGLIYHPTQSELESDEMSITMMAAGISIIGVIVVYTILRRKAEREDRIKEEEEAGSQIFGHQDQQ